MWHAWYKAAHPPRAKVGGLSEVPWVKHQGSEDWQGVFRVLYYPGSPEKIEVINEWMAEARPEFFADEAAREGSENLSRVPGGKPSPDGEPIL